MRLLTRVAERLADAASAAEVAHVLVEELLGVRAHATAVWAADADRPGGTRFLAAAHHDPGAQARLAEQLAGFPGGDPALLAVLRTGRPLVLDQLEVWPESPMLDLVATSTLGPAALVPLRGNHTTLGVLGIARRSGEPSWSPTDLEVVGLVARSAAAALDRVALRQELHRASRSVRDEQARAGDLLEAMDARAAIIAGDGTVVATNARWRAAVTDRTLALAHVVPVGASWQAALEQRGGPAGEAFARQVREVLAGKRQVARLDERKDDAVTEVIALPSAQGSAVVLQNDASWRRVLEEELTHRATHDDLTGLPNRAALREGLEASLERLGNGELLAVLFCDLDGFKDINDGLGHSVGDQVLVAVARRLRQRCRQADIVARFGGDEFVIVLPVPDVGRAVALADRLVDVLGDPIVVGDAEVAPGASVGIAVIDRRPAVDDPVEAVLRDADTAMYRAKERGRGRFELFDSSLRTDIASRLELASALRRAELDEEFALRFQARRYCGTRSLAGVEALLDWRRPRSPLVPPSDFVPIAERTGRIVPIGLWALRRALLEVSRCALPRMSVAVNVSPRQLGAPRFVESVDRALADTDVPPQQLLLEVTESALVDDPASARGVLQQLRDLGVQIALDDFGTGWSSLSFLRDLPVDVIKIDRSFVADLPIDPDACAVVSGVLGLGHGMGLVVVAEGVERAEQLDVLRDMGCDEYQGFIDGKPGPLGVMLADV